jgi:glycerol-3-phosphate cytidylyltransferase
MTIYTGGTFDIFHAGHVSLLQACRKLAGPNGSVTVSLNTDEFIRKYKNEYPVNSYDARERVLSSCRYVDNIIANLGGPDSKPAIIAVQPDIMVIGQDWANKDYYKQMGFTQEWLDELNITLVYVPLVLGLASSKLRRHICE